MKLLPVGDYDIMIRIRICVINDEDNKCDYIGDGKNL